MYVKTAYNNYGGVDNWTRIPLQNLPIYWLLLPSGICIWGQWKPTRSHLTGECARAREIETILGLEKGGEKEKKRKCESEAMEILGWRVFPLLSLIISFLLLYIKTSSKVPPFLPLSLLLYLLSIQIPQHGALMTLHACEIAVELDDMNFCL